MANQLGKPVNMLLDLLEALGAGQEAEEIRTEILGEQRADTVDRQYRSSGDE